MIFFALFANCGSNLTHKSLLLGNLICADEDTKCDWDETEWDVNSARESKQQQRARWRVDFFRSEKERNKVEYDFTHISARLTYIAAVSFDRDRNRNFTIVHHTWLKEWRKLEKKCNYKYTKNWIYGFTEIKLDWRYSIQFTHCWYDVELGHDFHPNGRRRLKKVDNSLKSWFQFMRIFVCTKHKMCRHTTPRKRVVT